jgi:hypothetical protein
MHLPLPLSAHYLDQALISARANTEAPRGDGCTPLLVAANAHQTECLVVCFQWIISGFPLHFLPNQALLAAQVNTEARNKKGDTSLHVCAWHGYAAGIQVCTAAVSNAFSVCQPGPR